MKVTLPKKEVEVVSGNWVQNRMNISWLKKPEDIAFELMPQQVARAQAGEYKIQDCTPRLCLMMKENRFWPEHQ
jgi:hypothetical protein